MHSCPRAEEVRRLLAAEEALSRELVGHVADCTICGALSARERQLDAAIDDLVTDALPPETLIAARQPLQVMRVSPALRLIGSGVAAVAIALFAVVGVAASGLVLTGVWSVPGTGADPEALQRDFTACYVDDAHAPDVERAGDFSVVVQHCLGDASDDLTGLDFEIVTVFNRDAEAVTACLRDRGWQVDPVLEPGGRFLVPPPNAPSGGEAERYHDDLDACSHLAAGGSLDPAPSPSAGVVAIEPQHFASWRDAEVAAGWQLLQPTDLPRGFRLTALQAFTLPHAPDGRTDDVVASFTGTGGGPISFSQARVADPAAFSFERSIPSPPADIELERIDIAGSLGYVMTGVPVTNEAGGDAGWDRDATVLVWQSSDVVYRLEGRHIAPEALLAIAGSLREVE